MLYVTCLGLFLPLLGFLSIMSFSDKISRQWAQGIACATLLISFLCFVGLTAFYTTSHMQPQNYLLWNWIPIEEIHAKIYLHLDPLALLMTLIITGIGFLIHVYSVGYMEHDEDYARYFACLNFFVFAMLLLVLAGDLLLFFVGWEGVGLASYLLIGFYYHRPSAANAATKSFIVNRVGDWGFLLGLLMTFALFDTSNMSEINAKAAQGFAVATPIVTILTLLYFWGATAKSAQIPLYTWLPDAMEGPTPVSALIHAATMVTAGVYFVVRMHPLFMLAPETLNVIGVIAAVTAFFAALCATAQTDLKRVLAYSTISQLGLMFLACGVGAFYSAMFHLTTHAFMKALLFLSAGNVIHMMQGTTDMNKMGGLYKKFPITHWFFLIGVLAMSGIPPLAAFFSKDLIMEMEYEVGFEKLFYLAMGASLMTAFYLMRAYCLTFLGSNSLPEKVFKTIKEAPKVMTIPVFVLAFLALTGGFLGFSFGKTPILEGFLQEVGVTTLEKEAGVALLPSKETWMSIGVALTGALSALLLYTRFKDRLGPNLLWIKNTFYVDQIYSAIFVKPLQWLASSVIGFFEPKIFERSLQTISGAVYGVSQEFQKMQSGQIRSYAAWMILGLGSLILYLLT